MDNRPQFSARLLAPKYWITWLGFGFWWLLAQLPIRVQLAAGSMLGDLLAKLVKRRVRIARRNLELCFPGLSEQERELLLRDNMRSVGKAFFETGMAWFMPLSRLKKIYRTEGLEHLKNAKAEGKGVILFAMHFTHLDLGAAMVCLQHQIDGSYRPHKNPVYDFIQFRQRGRYNRETRVITRNDLRLMIRCLKEGRGIWYAPDQDYGRKNSVFVDLYGVPAATVTATAKFARLSGAVVIPFTHHRRDDHSGYDLKIYPPLENFPIGDELTDARRINEVVEQCVSEHPEQYLWAHRRFKTRPEGEPDAYAGHGIAPSARDRHKG